MHLDAAVRGKNLVGGKEILTPQDLLARLHAGRSQSRTHMRDIPDRCDPAEASARRRRTRKTDSVDPFSQKPSVLSRIPMSKPRSRALARQIAAEVVARRRFDGDGFRVQLAPLG